MNRYGVWVLIIMLLIPVASAKIIPLNDNRGISTGSNDDYNYIKITKITGNEYVGINKNPSIRGIIGIGEKTGESLEMIGAMWMIPSYKIGGKWYLCPLRGITGISEMNDLGNGWSYNAHDNSLTCYQYHDNSVQLSADINISTIMAGSISGNDASIKIGVNTTLNVGNPQDTGFAFLFFPENPEKFRYAEINGQTYDLAGVEGEIPVGFAIKFLRSNFQEIAELFNWSDMIGTGNYYSEIVTVGDKKGLLIGSYGYGANKTISIDPYYYVDLNPNPATYYAVGASSIVPDSSYGFPSDVTATLTDGNTGTFVTTIDSAPYAVIKLNWDYTYEAGTTVFLRWYDYDSGSRNIIVYPYYNDTDINSSMGIPFSTTGYGFYNINVTSLLLYEQGLGFNYTSLRMTGNGIPHTNIGEAMIRVETNDTQPPTINSCDTTKNNFSCGENVTFYCNITDNLEVAYASFTIDGQNYLAYRNDSIYYYTITNNNSGNKNYAFTNVEGCDIFNQCDSTNPAINVLYTCSYPCTENWFLISGECQENNSKYVEYFDLAACGTTYTLPIDNGTWIPCDYYANDFNCTISNKPLLTKKMDYLCLLPYNNLTEWSCINSVRHGTYDYLQVNPEKTEKGTTILSATAAIETREYFVTRNGILNAYITDKNLAADTPFLLTTTCRNGNVTLYNEQVITPDLKPLYEGIDALVWVKENAAILVGIIILSFALVFLAAAGIRELRRR